MTPRGSSNLQPDVPPIRNVVGIGVPRISTAAGRVRWEVDVTGLPWGPPVLWYETDERYADFLTDRSDPALLALLHAALHAGTDLRLEGPVDAGLAANARNEIMAIVRDVIGNLGAVDVIAPQEVSHPGRSAPGVATGFTAGVDSYTVVVEHHDRSDVAAAERLTHLAFFNVGSHGPGDQGRILFRRRAEYVRRAATLIGLPLIEVDSNVDDFYPFSFFQQDNPLRTMSAAFLLQRGIGTFYVASSYTHQDNYPRPFYDLAIADVDLCPLVATSDCRAIAHGNFYSRTEKTTLVAEFPLAHTTLNVCVHGEGDGSNCSACWKCLRTAFTLEILGVLDRFESVFDLGLYRAMRDDFLDVVATSRDPLVVEVRELARAHGVAVPSRWRRVRRRVHRRTTAARHWVRAAVSLRR